MIVTAKAPGKLILSGEHAVVHGNPAIAIAVERHATATISNLPEAKLRFSFAERDEAYELPVEELASLRAQLKARHALFMRGECAVRQILKHPLQMAAFAVAELLGATGKTIEGGLSVEISTTLPIGAGMGASAATTLAVLRAAAGFFGAAPLLNDFYRWTLNAEKLQHGRPSGVDSWVCCHGGCLRFRQGKAKPLYLERPPPLQLVYSGQPASTTGECVEAVQSIASEAVWRRFEDATDQMELALTEADDVLLGAAIRANQRLLSNLGVVPQKVQNFVSELRDAGGSAKISGAGAVRGDAAGVLLALADKAPLQALCDKYGYQLLTVDATI